jgi:diaminopimelate epimerase
MIPFVKAHACGNDFLIIEERFVGELAAGDTRAVITRRLCDRHIGIGADGVEWLNLTGPIARAVLANADGSIAEISGNGTRCVAAWLSSQSGAQEIEIETGAGRKLCRILSSEGASFQIETGMGQPTFNEIAIDEFRGVRVSMGNPHFVLFVENFPSDWIEIGARLSVHAAFPQGTNVEFVRVPDTNSIEFRIFERGAGPTLSSGTGTCAVAVAAIATRNMPRELRVISQGGEQQVRWQEEVFLTGPAQLIARGEAYP